MHGAFVFSALTAARRQVAIGIARVCKRELSQRQEDAQEQKKRDPLHRKLSYELERNSRHRTKRSLVISWISFAQI